MNNHNVNASNQNVIKAYSSIELLSNKEHINSNEYEQLTKHILNQYKYYPIQISKYFKIPYFTYGNTINYYLFTNNISNKQFKYPLFTLGGDSVIKFITCFIIALLFLTAAYMFIYFNLPNKHIHIIIFLLISFFFFALISTFLTNPGTVYVSDNEQFNNTEYNYCSVCKVYTHKTKQVEHCDICNVCCEGRDHHCSIYGKCIGKGNKHYFYMSVIGTCLTIIGVYGTILYTAFQKYKHIKVFKL